MLSASARPEAVEIAMLGDSPTGRTLPVPKGVRTSAGLSFPMHQPPDRAGLCHGVVDRASCGGTGQPRSGCL